MRALVLVLLLTGCGAMHRPACVTNAGMFVSEPAPAGFCERLQEAESRVLIAFRDVAPFDPRFATADDRLSDWEIQIVPFSSWYQTGSGIRISGETLCPEHIMRVNKAMPLDGSLPHEMAHAIQNCQPVPPIDKYDPDHSNWGPIYDALNLIGS